MIITTMTFQRRASDPAFAWAGLSRYQNAAYVAETIAKNHEIPKKEQQNAKKQAHQIRQCLIQANEYHRASEVVGLSTKPLLLYYSIMSLALAQILYKGTGMVSLDKARGQHANHGLKLLGASEMGAARDLHQAASTLRALPVEGPNGTRRGTFHLWQNLARETPVGGEIKTTSGASVQNGFRLLLGVLDRPYPLFPTAGLTLMDCFRSLPCMSRFLSARGISPALARATFSGEVNNDAKTHSIRAIIHPTDQPTLNKVSEKILFAANSHSNKNIVEFESGYMIDIIGGSNNPFGQFQFPNSTQILQNEVWLFSENEILNEFGLFYVSLYILGNYVRYFPDKWMVDVDQSSELALAALELISAAEERIPLLALSEMSRTFIVGA